MSGPGGPSEHPRDILHARGLEARHHLGQNFLIDTGAMDRIVEAAGVGPEDVVLEIGTGLGRMTARLAARARHVVSVEIDDRLYEVAGERLAGAVNVTLLNCDFLASKHAVEPDVTAAVRDAMGENPLKVVANLPYKISSPAIVNLLEWDPQPVGLTVMLQAEVVARLTAHPGTHEYGPLTVVASYWAQAEHLMKVPRQAFWPPPQVSSAVVQLTVRTPEVRALDYSVFAQVVARLLQSRRKSLGRVLRMHWGAEQAATVLAEMGLERSCRAETLAPEAFVRIANVLARRE